MSFKCSVSIAKIWHIGEGRERKSTSLFTVEDSRKKKSDEARGVTLLQYWGK